MFQRLLEPFPPDKMPPSPREIRLFYSFEKTGIKNSLGHFNETRRFHDGTLQQITKPKTQAQHDTPHGIVAQRSSNLPFPAT